MDMSNKSYFLLYLFIYFSNITPKTSVVKLGDAKRKEMIGFSQYFSLFIKEIKEIMKNT